NEDNEYTQHCYKSVRADFFQCSQAEAKVVVKEALALFEEWRQTSNAVLWVDEWPELTSISNPYPSVVLPLARAIAGAISTLTSGGVKRQQAIYCLGPKMVAGEMTSEGKAIKACKLLYLSIAPGKSVRCGQTMVTMDYDLLAQVGRNFSIDEPTVSNSPVDKLRIAYAEGAWMPVGLDGHKLSDIPLPKPEEVPAKASAIPERIPVGSAPELTPEPAPPLSAPIKTAVADAPPEPAEKAFLELDELFSSPPPTKPPTPHMDAALKSWAAKATTNQHLMLVSLLEQLRSSTQEVFTASQLMSSAWGVSGARSGYFPDKKGENATPFLDLLIRSKFLEKSGDKYKIIFR
ncbi:MAG: hypothetical protein AAF329_18600, partial [Cyanobacteria bacterium P01_A01_bin.17]